LIQKDDKRVRPVALAQVIPLVLPAEAILNPERRDRSILTGKHLAFN